MTLTPDNAILTAAGFQCRACGGVAPAPRVPLTIPDHLARLRAFTHEHATCQPAPVPSLNVSPPPPAFAIGDPVEFDLRNKPLRGKVHKLSEPHGLDLLIKYHGGNLIWRKAKHVRPAPLTETLPTT